MGNKIDYMLIHSAPIATYTPIGTDVKLVYTRGCGKSKYDQATAKIQSSPNQRGWVNVVVGGALISWQNGHWIRLPCRQEPIIPPALPHLCGQTLDDIVKSKEYYSRVCLRCGRLLIEHPNDTPPRLMTFMDSLERGLAKLSGEST
jgi:hypothetical protein